MAAGWKNDLGANGLYIDQRPPHSRAVWAQACGGRAGRPTGCGG